MFPLNDTEPNRYSLFPFMTVLLIAANVLVLALEPSLPAQEQRLYYLTFGFTPLLIWNRIGGGVVSNLTAMFLHGGWFHLASNMFALWVFGRRVEDACGPWRFLLFYLFAGTCAHLATALVMKDSSIPSIGASGAVFGVMGAYLLMFPGGRIRTLILIEIVPIWPKLRAVWVVLYFLVLQIPPALDIFLNDADYGIGYWAHLGGFFASAAVFLFLRPEAFARYLSDTAV